MMTFFLVIHSASKLVIATTSSLNKFIGLIKKWTTKNWMTFYIDHAFSRYLKANT